MELKEGMYARTDKGYIFKINEFIEHYTKGKRLGLKNIVKTSYNIIDLIEVGDYVNGHKIKEVYSDKLKFGEDGLILTYTFNHDTYYLLKEDIKSIVTKERFKSMEYEVK